eukprot:TRINITY_DN37168_c0_g1_i1.p1 TRINITY_DN37168_c0_g1~~TRINITY_DN37168_c0_g1_i1.p1  ORF type:complete len:439 (+),score=93.88 TRINITY_DN37168_c0_g1_i1:59-1375(+)
MGAGASAEETEAIIRESTDADLSAALASLSPAARSKIAAAIRIDASAAPKSAGDLRDEINLELTQAWQVFETAIEALCVLSKGDIGELRNLGERTPGILLLAQALCILFDKMPEEQTADAFWQMAASEILQDPRLLNTMVDWAKREDDDARAKAYQAVKEFCDAPEFEPGVMEATSIAAAAMSKWVRAVVAFAAIIPKRKELRQLEDAEEKAKSVEPKMPEEPEVLFELVINSFSGENILTIPEASSRLTRADIVAQLVAGGHALPAGHFYKLSIGDKVVSSSSTLADLSCPTEIVAVKLENPHTSALSKAREEIEGCDAAFWRELRALSRPPNGVFVTFKACLKLWHVPIPANDQELWDTIQKEFLKEPQQNRIERVKDLDPDQKPEERLAAILDSIKDEAFAIENVARSSLLAKIIAEWVHTLAKYYQAIVTGENA